MTSKVLYGSGCIDKNKQLLRALGERCLIVTGAGGAERSGALGDMTAALDSTGIAWRHFSGIGANPLISSCKAAGDAARDFGAQFIVGIGGGSSLDGAKAAALYAANDIGPSGIYSLPEDCPCLPIVIVGTTAGSGSEVTNASVLTTDETGVKKSVSKGSLYAKISFCDPRYTYSLPPYQTLSTACDAFSHAVESYLCNVSDCISEMYALSAIKIIYPLLAAHRKDMSDLKNEERDALYAGSILAGFAINTTGTCFPHPLGYVVTEKTGIPHGLATAAFLPAFIERASIHCPRKLIALEGVTGQRWQDTCSLISSIAAPPDGCLISVQDVDGQAQRLASQKNYLRSPGGFTGEEATALIKSLFS